MVKSNIVNHSISGDLGDSDAKISSNIIIVIMMAMKRKASTSPKLITAQNLLFLLDSSFALHSVQTMVDFLDFPIAKELLLCSSQIFYCLQLLTSTGALQQNIDMFLQFLI